MADASFQNARLYRLVAACFVVLVPLLTLTPLVQTALNRLEESRFLNDPRPSATLLGYDWVYWQDDDGGIRAAYVFPRGPAWAAGIREGDALLMLDGKQYFQADLLKDIITGVAPGSTVTYTLLRDGELVTANVTLTAHPTFLYPYAESLWQFSLWGFTLGAFLHVLGLVIAGPLALRSAKARSSLLLIATSSLWIFANLLRLMLAEFGGPPPVGTVFDQLFRGLTLVGLIGWIGFPALLVQRVLSDTRLTRPALPGRLHLITYMPPVVLGAWALDATISTSLGPLTLVDLIAPILFYVCCYIGLAALLVFLFNVLRPDAAGDAFGTWGRVGSLATLVIALLAALAVPGMLPFVRALPERTTGWLIVCGQLLSVAPITLVSFATLKLGKIDQVLTRALTYVTVLGLLFFATVGGFALIERYFTDFSLSRNVVAGVYVVVLLLVFERLARRVRVYAATVFATERQRVRQRLVGFQEQIRTIMDHGSLVQRTIRELGEAFNVRSGVLYVRPPGEGQSWISSRYHPEPPYLTERVVAHIWPHIERDGRIWARNPELDESRLPDEDARLLVERGAAVVVPIMGDGSPMGVIILGARRNRRSVFNLEDLDMLRTMSGQLALAIERLSLVERERELVRQSAEAQLVALRAQINPHFLFNALNTVVAYIEERPEQAEEVVEDLAAIFRYILQTGSRSFVPLQDELTLVGRYLRIEQARFGARLHVERAVDPALNTLPVPAFAVQTLVENAVKHGIEHQREAAVLRIEARALADGWGEITVFDSGTGIPELFGVRDGATAGTAFFGIGLTNVTERLEQLYGRADLLHFTSHPEEGTTATLRLPPSRTDVAAGDGNARTPPIPRKA